MASPWFLPQNWPNMNGSRQAFDQLRTVQEGILGYNSLRKRIKTLKYFPSKSAKIWEKA